MQNQQNNKKLLGFTKNSNSIRHICEYSTRMYTTHHLVGSSVPDDEDEVREASAGASLGGIVRRQHAVCRSDAHGQVRLHPELLGVPQAAWWAADVWF